MKVEIVKEQQEVACIESICEGQFFFWKRKLYLKVPYSYSKDLDIYFNSILFEDGEFTRPTIAVVPAEEIVTVIPRQKLISIVIPFNQ